MNINPLELINKSNKLNNYCNPRNKNSLGFTCFSKNDILELVAIYNSNFCDNNKKFCYKHKIIEITQNGKERPIKNIYDDLKTKLILFNKKNKKEYCWLKIKEFKEKFINKENLFVPQMPYEWCSDIKKWRISRIEAPWLSNFDIDNIIEQYEYKYHDFKFLGSSPIDFRKKKRKYLCS